MTERPILFNSDMVRAILEGRKTQTRRPVKGIPHDDWLPAEMCATTGEGWQTAGHSGQWWCDCCGVDGQEITSPFGIPGDRLWVRESFASRLDEDHKKPSELDPAHAVFYWADGIGKCANTGCGGAAGKIRPSIHMPRWASRITLKVLDVRVERVQDITARQCVAEGVRAEQHYDPVSRSPCDEIRAFQAFVALWDSIYGEGAWESNPWVWVVEFERTATEEG